MAKIVYVFRPKKRDCNWDDSVAVFKTIKPKIWNDTHACTWDYRWVSRNFGIRLKPGEVKAYKITAL